MLKITTLTVITMENQVTSAHKRQLNIPKASKLEHSFLCIYTATSQAMASPIPGQNYF